MDSLGRPLKDRGSVDGSRGIEAVRDAIIDQIKKLPYRTGSGINVRQILPLLNITGTFAYATQSDVLFMEAMWSLVHDGIIVPGRPSGMSVNAYAASEMLSFPDFTVTPLGIRILETPGAVHPLQIGAYMSDARRRAGAVDDVIMTYLAEAVRDHRNGCELSASVMLGVSAEMLMKWLISRFVDHVAPARRQELEKKREELWMRTDKLFDTFIRRMKEHFKPDGVPRDLELQVDAHLDQLQTLIRVNRDDASHGRPQRADAQLVGGQLELYLSLLTIVRELADALSSAPCTMA